MTTLGDDIRAQKVVADRLSSDLSDAAMTLRRRIAATDWVSSSADSCRTILTGYADSLDARSRDATDFGSDIWSHASAVEGAEATIAAIPAAVTTAATAAAVASLAPAVSAARAVGTAYEAVTHHGSSQDTAVRDTRGMGR